MDEATLITREIQSLEYQRAMLMTTITEIRGETEFEFGRPLLTAELEKRRDRWNDDPWDHRWDRWMTDEEKEEFHVR